MRVSRRVADAADMNSDVLIVGAGPTGLVLACELLSQGIEVRVIDKSSGAALESRAIGLHARTLEMLDSMGLVERFLDHGQRVDYFRWYSDGRPIATFALSWSGARYAFLLDIPQDRIERLLRQRLVELGGVVEQSVELTGFTQDSECVTAMLKDAQGLPRTVTAKYLVGCDGAHSRVRHELGLAFEGHPYAQHWLLADVLVDWDRPEDSVQALFCRQMPPLIGFPMRDHRWRLTLPYAGEHKAGPPTLDEFQHFVDLRAPERPRLSDPTWLASFHVHRRSTKTYQRGRVMLAGDAVHVHSPAGGQGMNTGMLDAHNLGWKLALVVSGTASDELLDTYGEERGPVAAGVLSLTHALVRVGTLENGFKRALRDTVLPLVCRSPVIQSRAARRLSQVGVDYRGSRLAQYGGGERMPDREVQEEGRRVRLYDVLRRRRHALLLPGVPLPPELDPYRAHLRIVASADGQITLIRPDGYIAARRTEGVLSYLRTAFIDTATSTKTAVVKATGGANPSPSAMSCLKT
jgi:2-polyprenyl-6-methoxyphenol hydroxylase-like FAD-dependent oxidoreductase